MKKFLILLVLPLVLLTSCGKPNSNNSTENKQQSIASNNNKSTKESTIKDFYPLNENVRLKYKGNGSEFADKNVYVDYLHDNKIQLRVINTGTTTGEVIEIANGELRTLSLKHEFYYRDDLTYLKNNKYDVLIKEPLVKGTSWTTLDGDKRYISDTEKIIKTPLGEYKTLEITTEGKDSKTVNYYALNVGLVKTVFKGKDNTEISSSLEKIDKNVPVVQTVKFYYPDSVNDKIVYKDIKLSFNTNDTIISQFEKHFKNSPDKNIMRLMGNNCKINKLYLDPEKPLVRIDFSSNFVKELNAGSGTENEVLKCIANTLGDYYNVKEVSLTIDGKPYASGHIILQHGETLKVNLKDAIKLQ